MVKLSPSNKKIVAGVVALVALYLVYKFVYTPILSRTAQVRKALLQRISEKYAGWNGSKWHDFADLETDVYQRVTALRELLEEGEVLKTDLNADTLKALDDYTSQMEAHGPWSDQIDEQVDSGKYANREESEYWNAVYMAQKNGILDVK